MEQWLERVNSVNINGATVLSFKSKDNQRFNDRI